MASGDEISECYGDMEIVSDTSLPFYFKREVEVEITKFASLVVRTR